MQILCYTKRNQEWENAMKTYRKRIADQILLKKLQGKGAVLIEGI